MPDVTYVVKTGRQVVERKQVDFPGVLTSQIDAIKQHFNDLGAQVFGSLVSGSETVEFFLACQILACWKILFLWAIL